MMRRALWGVFFHVFAIRLPDYTKHFMEANPVISGNVLQRILFIRNGDQVGTAFTIEIDERQYLITARHLVPPESNPVLIDVFSNGQWSRVNVTTIPVAPDDVDISVLAAPIQLTPTPPINVDGGCYLSEQVYFLGFPYGLRMDEDNATSINNGLPLPFVKHAIISAFEGLGLSSFCPKTGLRAQTGAG